MIRRPVISMSGLQLRNLFFLGSFIISLNLHGQYDSETLERARAYHDEGKLRSASLLLEELRATGDLPADVLWLYAQNTYWRKQFNKSEQLYLDAIALDPGNFYLKLDYVDALLNMGRFAKAREALNRFTAAEQGDHLTQFYRAKLHFWTGDFKGAAAIVRVAERGRIPQAETLASQIAQVRALTFSLDGHYASDTQPLERFGATIEGGKYFTGVLHPRIKITLLRFMHEDNRA